MEQTEKETVVDNLRSKCLNAAADLVNGDRRQAYGEPLENFQRVATGWQTILGQPVTPHQVALCMAWLKIVRLVETPRHVDSYIDAAAYAALAFELAETQGAQK